MAFLRKYFHNMILTLITYSQFLYNCDQSKKNFIGSLPTTSQNHTAVEFYYNPNIDSINYSERSHLYTSHHFHKKSNFSCKAASFKSNRSCNSTINKLNGSLTIEASIAFPIFILASFAVISIISIVYLQLSMQLALEETIRQTSKTAYISSLFLSLDENTQNSVSNEDPSITENLTTSIISSAHLRNQFANENNKKMINNPLIINGEKGVSFLSTSIDLEEGIADVVITYKVKLPFIPESFFSFNLSNRCYIHLYTGKELSKKQTAVDTYVYFTSHGSVFHFNKYCQYLLDYTEAVRYQNLNGLLNSCKKCVDETTDYLSSTNPIVYTTERNYCYHTSLNCPTFTGNVFRISYSSLKEDNELCQKCLEGK